MPIKRLKHTLLTIINMDAPTMITMCTRIHNFKESMMNFNSQNTLRNMEYYETMSSVVCDKTHKRGQLRPKKHK